MMKYQYINNSNQYIQDKNKTCLIRNNCFNEIIMKFKDLLSNLENIVSIEMKESFKISNKNNQLGLNKKSEELSIFAENNSDEFKFQNSKDQGVKKDNNTNFNKFNVEIHDLDENNENNNEIEIEDTQNQEQIEQQKATKMNSIKLSKNQIVTDINKQDRLNSINNNNNQIFNTSLLDVTAKNDTREVSRRSSIHNNNNQILNTSLLDVTAKNDPREISRRSSIQKQNESIISVSENGDYNLQSDRRNSSNTMQDQNNSRRFSMIESHIDMDETQLHQFNNFVLELNNHPQPILMLNSGLNIIQYNQFFSNILYYNKHELKEIPFTDLIHQSDMIIIQELNNMFQDDTIFNESLSSEQNYDNVHERDVKTMEMGIMDKSKTIFKFKVHIKPQRWLTPTGDEHCTLILYAELLNTYHNSLSIDPRNALYLSQSLFIQIVPQDISFGLQNNQNLDNFNSIFDISVSILFGIDIILNFFLAQEGEEGTQEWDCRNIAYHQLTSDFLMDLLATIPFDQLIDNYVINSSIIKSFKLIKFIRLVKMLRISKIFSLEHSFIKNFIGYDLIMILKKASGFLDLIRQNFQILIAAHFQTILFYQIKKNIEQDDMIWVQDQYGIEPDSSNFSIYIQTLNVNVKTALGLGGGASNLVEPIEIMIQMMWMFLGLSIFGQGIGNISSFLNHMNAHELEQFDTMNYFKDICDHYAVDNRVANLIKKDIRTYQKTNNVNDKLLYNKANILSHEVYSQLELQVQKEFIFKVKQFEKLPITVLRKLKRHSSSHKGIFKIQMQSCVSDVIFITKGKIILQDNKMNLFNIQSEGEIYGFAELLEFFFFKFDIEFRDLYSQLKIQSLREDQFFRNKDQERTINRLSKLIEEKSHEFQKIKSNPHTRDDQAILAGIFNPQKIVSSDDLEYLSVPFFVFEEFMIQDIVTFMHFMHYHMYQSQPISTKDFNDSATTLKKFEHSIFPALIISEKEIILECNIAQDKSKLPSPKDMIEAHLNDFVLDIEHNNIGSVRLLDKGIYYLKDKQNSLTKIEIDDVEFKQIVQMRENDGNDGNFNESEEKYYQYRLKKSLTRVYIVQFKLI